MLHSQGIPTKLDNQPNATMQGPFEAGTVRTKVEVIPSELPSALLCTLYCELPLFATVPSYQNSGREGTGNFRVCHRKHKRQQNISEKKGLPLFI